MKQKIFKYNFIYYLSIVYSVIIFLMFLIINFPTNCLKNGFKVDFVLNCLTENLLMLLSLVSFFLLLFKNRNSYKYLSLALLIFTLFLINELRYDFLRNGEIRYFSASSIFIIINIMIFFLVNELKIKKTKIVEKEN